MAKIDINKKYQTIYCGKIGIDGSAAWSLHFN